MAAVISATDCFVSADCGVMHLGAATGTPTVGLFTVTDPALYEPYGASNISLLVGQDSPARVADQIVKHIQRRIAHSRPLVVDVVSTRINMALVNRSPRVDSERLGRTVPADV
jgi:hypothetical protein